MCGCGGLRLGRFVLLYYLSKKKICVIVLKQGGVDQYECLPY